MDLLGQTFSNRYRVEELIGRGGMAEVYKVWDTQRGAHLAMKMLREDLAEDNAARLARPYSLLIARL